MMMYSPMEQFTIYPIFGIISNIALYLIIACILSVILTKNSSKILTNNWGILSESLFRTILNMLEKFVDKKATIYLPLFFSLSQIILFSNFLGLIPYSSTPTVEIILTLTLSFTIIIGFALLGFLTHKLYFLSLFLPGGTPILLIPLMILLEINAYLSRTLSLGLRLAINLITGHILVKVITGFLYIGYINNLNYILLSLGLFFLIILFCLEFLVAYLQCYIFIFISLLTLKDISLT